MNLKFVSMGVGRQLGVSRAGDKEKERERESSGGRGREEIQSGLFKGIIRNKKRPCNLISS